MVMHLFKEVTPEQAIAFKAEKDRDRAARAAFEKERADHREDPEWNALKHRAAEDRRAAENMRVFYTEAGLDEMGTLIQ